MEIVTIGIDNGLTGGMVALRGSGQLLKSAAMPTRKGYKGKNYVNERTLCRWIKDLAEAWDIRVVMEKPSFARDANAALSMADSYGTIRTVCHLLGLEVLEIEARDWQGTFFKRPKDAKETGWSTKTAAQQVAKGKWPMRHFMATTRSTKPHDGMVDAALIAEFGRLKANENQTTKT